MFGTYQRLNLPVSASSIAVIRAARLKIEEHHRRTPDMREERKRFYRLMLDYHSRARRLFESVR